MSETTDITKTDMLALVTIEPEDALAVFSTPFVDGQPHPIDTVLEWVSNHVGGKTADVRTAKGRDEIRSLAYKIRQAKTAIEEAGKRCADEQKKIPKLIDATRAYSKKKLDALHDKVRQPLTAYEAAEELRKANHVSLLARIAASHREAIEDIASVEVLKRLSFVQNLEINAATCDEYVTEYELARSTAITELHALLKKAVKREDEQAELQRLRALVGEKQTEASKEELRKEGEARALLDAENDARVVAERHAQEKRELQLAAERAEAERKAAVADAAQAAVEIAVKVRSEMEETARAAAAEQAKRAANTAHRGKINRAARQGLMVATGLDEATATKVMKAIISGEVPHVRVEY